MVYDATGTCLVFDPGCSTVAEQKQLVDYIQTNKLKPSAVIATHGHFDHIPGVRFITTTYGCPFLGNAEDKQLISYAPQQAEPFGFHFQSSVPELDQLIGHDDRLTYGDIELSVMHVPGHSAGSLAFYSADAGFVIVGDVLFRGSIGRTDLPGGNYDTLMESIKTHLLVLPPETRVLPGHGPETTIGEEINGNPFLV